MVKFINFSHFIVLLCVFKIGKFIDDCSTVYILHILSNNFLYYYEDINSDEDGLAPIANFVNWCFNFNNAKEFQVIDLIAFTMNITIICLLDNLYTCTPHVSIVDWIFDIDNRYYVKEQLEKTINTEPYCPNNSLFIFFTDIPCNNFTHYPDINELFGQNNLNKTMLFFKNKQLPAYFVFLKSPKTFEFLNNEQCDYMEDLKFEYNSNYFETRWIDYNSKNMSSAGNALCGSSFPGPPYKSSSGKNNGLTKILIILSSVFFVVIWLFIVFWVTQIKRRIREAKIEAFAEQHAKNISHILFGRYMDEWQISPRELKVEQDQILGKGIFGVVYKGFLKKKRGDELLEMDVAVKFPHEHANDVVRENMLKEISFMKALGKHENLLTMVAYIKSIENPVIATQYCSNGDLLRILKRHEIHFMSRQKCEDVEICLLLPDLIRISLEVCSGLIYMTKMKFIHRDVAARNVLLTENLTAKLSDFGLSCQFNTEHLSVIEKKGRFPIKNMPFEALRHGLFSEKSDVWSFGLLIFEMLSGGQCPFEQIPIEEFVEFLENEGKQEMPENTPFQLTQILNDHCFQKDPKQRAKFVELEHKLEQFYAIVLGVLQ